MVDHQGRKYLDQGMGLGHLNKEGATGLLEAHGGFLEEIAFELPLRNK